MSMGIALRDVGYLTVFHEGIDQPQGSLVVTMFGSMEVRMPACHAGTGVVDDGRESISPSVAFGHRVFLAKDV